MKQFFHFCDCVVFYLCIRQTGLKFVLSGMFLMGAVWALLQHEHHVLLSLHTQVFGYHSDPWNG